MLCGPAARDASACTCLQSGPACQDYWRAGAVFLGRVDSISRQAAKQSSRLPGTRRVTLTVIEAFSGVSPGTIEVRTGMGGGDCGYGFRQGAEYVVYAQRNEEGQLTVSMCSRTRQVEQASDDLSYARAIASGAQMPSRVVFEAAIAQRSLSRRAAAGEPRPLPDVGVTLERDGAVTKAATDAAGRFTLEGLPAGRYNVSLDLPEQFYADVTPKQLELPDPRACAELRATAYYDGRVSGRVVDATGHPVAGLTVELTLPAGLDQPLGPERIRDLTGLDGRFELVHVPPGRFIVGINTQRDRGGGLPHPRVFHPGVETVAAATRVPLSEGERVQLRDFVLPRAVQYTAVTGIVLEADGWPAPGARVYLKGHADTDYIVGEPAVTDASGRFVLAAISGRPYRLFAERQRSGTPNARLDSSEQVPFVGSVNLPPFRLTLRRRY